MARLSLSGDREHLLSADGKSRRSRKCDAVIVGGGIIGLAIGWRLLKAGLSVTIVEGARAGEAASSAAAGMLAPNAEARPGDRAFLDLAREGLALWPDFAHELEAATGTDVELRTDGIVMAVRGAEEAASKRQELDLRRRAGAPVEWLDAAALRGREPHLAEDVTGGLFFPQDGQVNNRRAAMALTRAFRAEGGRLLEATPVTGLLLCRGRAAGVCTDAGSIAAGVTILAAGAWTGSLPGWPREALPPVRPIKGQMAALKPDRPLIDKVIWSLPGPGGVYLVPRRDGRVIVGATVEDAGFDVGVTAEALAGLLNASIRLVPGLAEAKLVDMWAGLRPGSPDDAPVVGPAPIGGLVWATGHHRNGILLAPLTADAVCREVAGHERPPRYELMGTGRAALHTGEAEQRAARMAAT